MESLFRNHRLLGPQPPLPSREVSIDAIVVDPNLKASWQSSGGMQVLARMTSMITLQR